MIITILAVFDIVTSLTQNVKIDINCASVLILVDTESYPICRVGCNRNSITTRMPKRLPHGYQ